MAEVEIVARVERRRKWTIEEKAALLAEVEAEGGKVTAGRAASPDFGERALQLALRPGRQRRLPGRFVGSSSVRAAGRIWRSGHRGASDAASSRNYRRTAAAC